MKPIIEVISISPSSCWVCVQDGKDEVGMLCDPCGETIQIGDHMTWQNDVCYWTPKYGTEEGIRLPKLSSSGLPKFRALEILRDTRRRNA
jgi:hypothetical protein